MKLRTIARYIGTACLVIGVLLASYYVARLSLARAALNKRVAALHQAQIPVSYAEFSGQGSVPDEENAYVWLKRAQPGLIAVERKLLGVDFTQPADADLVAKTLSSNKQVVECVEKAAALQRYQVDFNSNGPLGVIGDQLDRVQLLRHAAHVLSCKARLQLRTGSEDDSLKTALAIVKLSSHFNEEPGFTSSAVRNSLILLALQRIHEALISGELDPELYSEVEDALAQIHPRENFRRAIEGEIVWQIELSRQWPISFVPSWLSMCSERLDMLKKSHESSLLTFPAFKAFAESQPEPHHKSFLEVDIPLLNCQSCAYVTAMVNTLRIHNSIQLQRLSDPNDVVIQNAWPDPFTNERLKVVKGDGAWKVYSVGRDLHDDGGNVEGDKPTDMGWVVPMQDVAKEPQ